MKEVWQNDLELYRDRAPIIRISGNVNDLLPVSTNGTSDFVSLEEYLNSITGSVPNDFTVFYNAGKGFYNSDSRSINRFASVSGVSGKSRSLSEDAKAVDRAMRNLNGNGKMTLVFDSSIRTLRPPYMKGEDILAFSAIRDSFTAKDNPGHKLMFISEEEGDIPSFMIAKPFAQTVTIPLPNQEVRRDFIASQLNGSFTPEQLMKLSKEAEEMSLVELKAAVKGHLNDSFGEVKKAIGVFHNGHSEDAFAHIDTDAVTHIEDSLKGEIFGQDRAIRQVADMVQNGASALNLARRDGSSYSPRGFAVMAGPSGVGKTATAKAVAEILFGSPDNMIRIDMAELSQSFTISRLIGAPPGYVGYGDGIFTKLRANPRQVVLFDEMEKADPSIWNLFLSILEDGRISQGESFRDCYPILTTNLGAAESMYESDPVQAEHIVKECIRDYCVNKLNKPELYSRIRDHIVVYNALDEEAKHQIFRHALDTSRKRILENAGVDISLADGVADALYRQFSDDDRGCGDGRGVKEWLETRFYPELSKLELRERLHSGDKVTVTGFMPNPGGIELQVELTRAPAPAVQQNEAQNSVNDPGNGNDPAPAGSTGFAVMGRRVLPRHGVTFTHGTA